MRGKSDERCALWRPICGWSNLYCEDTTCVYSYLYSATNQTSDPISTKVYFAELANGPMTALIMEQQPILQISSCWKKYLPETKSCGYWFTRDLKQYKSSELPLFQGFKTTNVSASKAISFERNLLEARGTNFEPQRVKTVQSCEDLVGIKKLINLVWSMRQSQADVPAR